jgi:3-oxoacyl-[acyl-carrier protein] reductase
VENGNDRWGLDGLGVVVTGGTRGIGKGIARVFAGAGAGVLVTGRDVAGGRAAAAELAAAGDVHFLPADVSRRADCDAIAAAALARFGRIDVLCANAGIFPEVPLAEMSADQLHEMFAVNLDGTVFSVQACLAALEMSGRGRVVLTSSITGPITGGPGWSHYGASKAAQLGFMRTAAIELAPKKITVNAVLPGNVATEGLAALGADYEASMTASIPLGRLGTVDEIGYAALFLASEQAGFITGHSLVVDGGQTLPESLAAVLPPSPG